MSSRVHTATRHRLFALLAVALTAVALAVAAVLASAAPAVAHDALLSTDPPDGATLDALPTQLTLTFSGTVSADLGGNQVVVTDATGTSLADGDPVVADNVMTQPLLGGAGGAGGAVTVAWRIVSEDGHPVSGEFAFTVAGAASPAATDTSSPSPEPTPTPAATPAVTATPAAAQQANPVPWIVLGAALIATLAGVAYLLASRGGRAPAGPHPDR